MLYQQPQWLDYQFRRRGGDHDGKLARPGLRAPGYDVRELTRQTRTLRARRINGGNSRSFRGLATPVVIEKLQNFTIDDFGLVSWDCMSSALDDQLFAVRNCLR
jgi:hypothetical protein